MSNEELEQYIKLYHGTVYRLALGYVKNTELTPFSIYTEIKWDDSFSHTLRWRLLPSVGGIRAAFWGNCANILFASSTCVSKPSSSASRMEKNAARLLLILNGTAH